MTMRQAMVHARRIAAGRCNVQPHRGEGGERAIRITATWPDPAREIAAEIAEAIHGEVRTAAQWCAVWF